MKIVYYILSIALLGLILNCSSVSKAVILERNDIKNKAADNTENANTFMEQHQYEKAIEYFQKALDDNIMVDNIPGIIKSYADIAKVHLIMEDYSVAFKYLQEGMILVEEDETLLQEKSVILNGLGEVFYYLKKYDQSALKYQAALDIERKLKNQEKQALIMRNQAKIKRSLGNYKEALDIFLSAVNLLENLYEDKTIENVRSLSVMYYSIGQSYSKLQDYKKAIEYIEKALEIDKLIENSSGIADDYYALGILSEKSGKTTEVILKYYIRSRRIYKLLDNVKVFVELTETISDIYLAQKELRLYFDEKRVLYLLTRNDRQEKHRLDILQLMNHENVDEFFSKKEIKDIIKTFKK